MTVTSFLQSIPVSDSSYPLAQQILTKHNFITNNTSGANARTATSYRQELPGLYIQLINSLLDRGRLSPAAILNSVTYNQANADSANVF